MSNDPGLLAEGKTKWVLTAADPDQCVFRMKDDVTMHDDPDQTIVIPGKGEWSNTTTCCMFDVLRRAGVPVAYVHQLFAKEMLALRCTMISLEMVGRRFARGSYCERHPGTDGQRFEKLVVEFYLKTSAGVLQRMDGVTQSMQMPMIMKENRERPLDDPFIDNPFDFDMWVLRNPHLPIDHPNAILTDMVKPALVLPNNVTPQQLEDMTREAFLALEDAWAAHDCELHDIKFEFGIGKNGVLYLADVVDADSWRMLDPKREEMSKQVARDRKPHPEIRAKYMQAAEMAQKVRETVCSA